MEVTETLSQGLKREFKVVLAGKDLAGRVDDQLTELRGKAKINGFRPGKVPVSHLRRLYGPSIMAEVVNNAVNEANQQIVKDRDLKLAMQPKLDFPQDKESFEQAFEQNGSLAYTVALEVMPKFEVGGFDDIAVEKWVADVSDAEVDAIVSRLADQARTYTPKEAADATAENGDKVTLDFVGKLNGEPFEGGSATDQDLTLGSQSFIPGFEDQVAGMKVGENKTISLTFPEAYAAPKLAGQPATFDVTVKAIAAPGDVTIDDEFAKTYGFDDLAALRKSVKDKVEGDYASASRLRWKRELLDALDQKFQFDLPEGLVAQEFDGVWRQVETERKQSGRSFEDDGTTEEASKEEYRKIAERRVRLALVLAEVGEKAKVQVTDEAAGRALAEQLRNFPGQEKQIWDFYMKNPEAMAQVRAPLFEDLVIDHIVEQAKVTERRVTKEELMQPLPDDDQKAVA